MVTSRDLELACLGSNPRCATHPLSHLGLFLNFSVAQFLVMLMMVMIMTMIAAIIGCDSCNYFEDTEIIYVV